MAAVTHDNVGEVVRPDQTQARLNLAAMWASAIAQAHRLAMPDERAGGDLHPPGVSQVFPSGPASWKPTARLA